ncbi:putative bifunctional diguanylate cyclase/phosphodiesterase [Paenibacillus methanolicus]|uniref:PAS domain S-box-containing protein/diguanylate cyclase (GGDEF)-like protein n=1 Tax=Paenibacillus methanolicus TaxID=582686 RepID=A0A5S5C842_9BACL|nr:EAL domain-containing protein [Paenibacillus methanolicus]TYP75575.1 PAS domain S-box-containing protein/diguanylate cyclase (GGDEF)-like protein [Paenibacillus methanolicus]
MSTSLLLPVLNQLLPFLLIFYMAVEIFARNPGNRLHWVTSALFFFLGIVFLGDFLFAALPYETAREALRFMKFPAVFLTMTAALYFFVMISKLGIRKLWMHVICLFPVIGLIPLVIDPAAVAMEQRAAGRVELFSGTFLAVEVVLVCYCLVGSYVLLARAGRRTALKSWMQKESQRIRIILAGCLLVGLLLGAGLLVGAMFERGGERIFDFVSSYGVLVWVFAIRQSMMKYDLLSFAGKRYELVFELSPNGTVVLDEKGGVVEANSAFRKLAGVKDDEPIEGMCLSRLFGVNQAFLAAYRQSFQTQTPLEMELEIVNTAGRVMDVELIGEFMEMEEEQLAFFIVIDMTERKSAERMLARLAYEDTLTGLGNSRKFYAAIEEELSRALAGMSRLALLLIDLDQFKWINDTLGHSAGDRLLQQIADRLRTSLPAGASAYRLGGDEFAILLPAREDADATGYAAGLLRMLVEPMQLRGSYYSVSASVGIVVAPEDGREVEMLIRQADTAMYAAKQGGRNRYHRCTPELNAKAQEQMKLIHGLSAALELKQFELHYQPQVDARTGETASLEALLSWCSPELGRVAPAKFLPLAEESGAIIPIGSWVLEEVLKQIRVWLDRGCARPGMTVTVNISAQQLREAGFADRIEALLARYEVPAGALRLEITESTMITDMERTRQVCQALIGLGVTLGIDDVGSGYSSLGMLNRFPYRYIKLHHSLVRGIAQSREDYVIVRMLVEMARQLGKEVIAEGVESEAQLELLRDLGCRELQGYHIGVPMNAVEIAYHLKMEGARMAPPAIS